MGHEPAAVVTLEASDLDKEHQQRALSSAMCWVFMRLQEQSGCTEFPNLLLENCSGGGARFDPGMLILQPSDLVFR